MARSFALIVLVWYVLQLVSCNSKMVPNAPKQKKMHQNISLGSNGVDRERSLRKFTRTFALITHVWLVLLWVLCGSETVPNVPKQKETHENVSLGSNYVDQERSFWEILTRLCGTNFCFNCTRLAPFCTEFCAVAKWSQMRPNRKKRNKTWV